MWAYVWSGTTAVTCVAAAPRDLQCHIRVRALGVATDRDVVAHAVRAVTVDRHVKNPRLYLDTPSGLVELPHDGEPALTPFADELDAVVSGRRESASLAPRRHSAGDWVGFAVMELSASSSWPWASCDSSAATRDTARRDLDDGVLGSDTCDNRASSAFG